MTNDDDNPPPPPEFTPHLWDERPAGHSWVRQLTANDAKAQWGLEPKATLQANRVPLEDYIKAGGALRQDNSSSVPPTPGLPATSESVILRTATAIGQQIAEALASLPQASPSAANVEPHRLPVVVSDLIHDLPTVSGTNIKQLLNFLARLRSIFELKLSTETLIVQTALSKTQGQLRSVWCSAISTGISTDLLFRQVLDTFLPGPVRHQALSQHLFRVQRPKEPLSDFFSELRSFAGILAPDMTDAELLDTILTHMNPQCRARLSGFCHPSSTSDLVQLIPRMEAVRTTEGFYYSAYPPMAPQPDQHWAAPQAGYQHTPWYGQPQMTPPPNQNYYTPQSNQYWYPPPHWTQQQANQPRQQHQQQLSQNSARHHYGQRGNGRNNNRYSDAHGNLNSHQSKD